MPREVTDASGAFHLRAVDPRKPYLLTVRAEGFAPAETEVLDLEPYRTRSGVTVSLSRGMTIVGRIEDASGRPIRDVALTAKKAAARGHGMMMFGGPGGAA